MTSSMEEPKYGKVSPENLLWDKSNNWSETILKMDSGTFLENLFLPNIRISIPVALPMLSGSSPEKLFRATKGTSKFRELKRQDGRGPVRLLSDKIRNPTSISTSHCGNIPPNWFSLKSRNISLVHTNPIWDFCFETTRLHRQLN